MLYISDQTECFHLIYVNVKFTNQKIYYFCTKNYIIHFVVLQYYTYVYLDRFIFKIDNKKVDLLYIQCFENIFIETNFELIFHFVKSQGEQCTNLNKAYIKNKFTEIYLISVLQIYFQSSQNIVIQLLSFPFFKHRRK